jgi:hypothetical protein
VWGGGGGGAAPSTAPSHPQGAKVRRGAGSGSEVLRAQFPLPASCHLPGLLKQMAQLAFAEPAGQALIYTQKHYAHATGWRGLYARKHACPHAQGWSISPPVAANGQPLLSARRQARRVGGSGCWGGPASGKEAHEVQVQTQTPIPQPPHSHLGSRGGVLITVYRLPFPGVVARHLNVFQGRLRAITSVESVYFICICAHQTGYGGQWGD